MLGASGVEWIGFVEVYFLEMVVSLMLFKGRVVVYSLVAEDGMKNRERVRLRHTYKDAREEIRATEFKDL